MIDPTSPWCPERSGSKQRKDRGRCRYREYRPDRGRRDAPVPDRSTAATRSLPAVRTVRRAGMWNQSS